MSLVLEDSFPSIEDLDLKGGLATVPCWARGDGPSEGLGAREPDGPNKVGGREQPLPPSRGYERFFLVGRVAPQLAAECDEEEMPEGSEHPPTHPFTHPPTHPPNRVVPPQQAAVSSQQPPKLGGSFEMIWRLDSTMIPSWGQGVPSLHFNRISCPPLEPDLLSTPFPSFLATPHFRAAAVLSSKPQRHFFLQNPFH